jgi:dipeptidyl aminopeptidase/acylaminoacyl peptidase
MLLLALCLLSADVSEWTPAHSMKFKDVGAVRVSPDGKLAVWTERQAVMTEDKSEYRTHVHLGKSDGSWRVQLTRGEKSADNPAFSPDGQYVLFSSDRSGKNNVYRIGVMGGEAEQITDWKGTLAGFALSPDGKHLVFSGREEDKEAEKKTKSKLDFKIVNDKPQNSTLWIVTIAGDLPAKAEKLVDKEYHSTDFDWSPDSKKIAFVHRPRPDADMGRKADIAEVDVETKTVRELAGDAVSETSPRYSPDGRYLALVRGTAARGVDGSRLALLTRETGAVRALSPTPDDQPSLVGWTPDSRALIFAEQKDTKRGLYRMPVDGPAVEMPVGAPGTLGFGTDPNAAGTHLGFTLETPEEPREAYVWAMSGSPVRVSAANRDVARPPLGRTEVIQWKSKDGRTVDGLLTYPVGYTAGQKVPLLLNIHGGPSGVFGETFIGAAGLYPVASFAQKGIAVLRPNPRGSSGYGAKVRQMVIQDWGGRDFEDLMSGVDHVVAMGVAHPDKLAVMGWSYGGYMTAWTVTQTERFKAAAIGAGITNHVSMYGTQDIPSVYEDYFGGPPWEHRDVYRKSSPIEYIDRVKTPTLLLHGERDDRVPVTQAYEFHRALERRGVETKMIVYPRTPHGPREPKFLQHVAEQHLDWALRFLQ